MGTGATELPKRGRERSSSSSCSAIARELGLEVDGRARSPRQCARTKVPRPDGRFDHARARELFVRERHRVAMHAQALREFADRRQPRAGGELLRLDLAPDLLRDLPVDRLPLGPGLALQRDAHGGAD